MHKTLLALQDDAWNLKDLCDELAPRSLSAGDVAAIESVRRDLARLTGKVQGVKDKRKKRQTVEGNVVPAIEVGSVVVPPIQLEDDETGLPPDMTEEGSNHED